MIKITLPRLISHPLLLWALILSVQSSAPDAATLKDASAPDPKAASTKDVAAGECPDAASVDEHPLFGLIFLQLNKVIIVHCDIKFYIKFHANDA